MRVYPKVFRAGKKARIYYVPRTAAEKVEIRIFGMERWLGDIYSATMRLYRDFTVRGTKGMYMQDTNSFFFDGQEETFEPVKFYEKNRKGSAVSRHIGKDTKKRRGLIYKT